MSDQREHFDDYAGNYHDLLRGALSVSGEGPEYYARGRVQYFSDCLRDFGVSPHSILDFGCGTGSEVPLLRECTGATRVVGADVSRESLRIANSAYGPAGEFLHITDLRAGGDFDAAYCNGVFHHIPAAEQLDSCRQVLLALRPGGVFGFFENNPWNPGTRYVMSRCDFDDDAVMIWPRAACRMLRAAGFEILRKSFLFVFPKALKPLRRIECALTRFPLGAQYQILCRKP